MEKLDDGSFIIKLQQLCDNNWVAIIVDNNQQQQLEVVDNTYDENDVLFYKLLGVDILIIIVKNIKHFIRPSCWFSLL